MTWADLLVRSLLLLAVSVEDCAHFNTEYICISDDNDKAVFGTDDSSLVHTYLVDSGASVHCCSKAELFTRFTEHQPNKRVRVASGAYVQVQAIGEVQINIKDQHGITRQVTLTNVFYCPDLKVDLISTKRLWKDNRIKTTLRDGCVLKDKSGGEMDGCKFVLPSSGKQYLLHSRKKQAVKRTQTMTALALEGRVEEPKVEDSDILPGILHARLGHTSATRIRRAYHTSEGIPGVSFDELCKLECDGCDKGGSRKPHFHKRPSKYRFVKFGQRIHSDLCGPFPPARFKALHSTVSVVFDIINPPAFCNVSAWWDIYIRLPRVMKHEITNLLVHCRFPELCLRRCHSFFIGLWNFDRPRMRSFQHPVFTRNREDKVVRKGPIKRFNKMYTVGS